MLTDDRKKQIAQVLSERLGQFQCPMCHKGPFSILDGYVSVTLQSNLKSYALGGPSIPSVGVVCTHCGYISLHALGALGLLETPKSEPPVSEDSNEKK